MVVCAFTKGTIFSTERVRVRNDIPSWKPPRSKKATRDNVEEGIVEEG
jgi:hypothetical protein